MRHSVGVWIRRCLDAQADTSLVELGIPVRFLPHYSSCREKVHVHKLVWQQNFTRNKVHVHIIGIPAHFYKKLSALGPIFLTLQLAKFAEAMETPASALVRVGG